LEPPFCTAGSLDCQLVARIRARLGLGSLHSLILRTRRLLYILSFPRLWSIRITGMFATLPRIALIAGIAGHVSGHAYVDKVVLAGIPYSGWLPFKCVLSYRGGFVTEVMCSDPYESSVPSRIVRRVPNDNPVLDPFSADLACSSRGEDPAGATADIQAGQTVQFIWSRVSQPSAVKIQDV
jgi:hypothetical protein